MTGLERCPESGHSVLGSICLQIILLCAGTRVAWHLMSFGSLWLLLPIDAMLQQFF